MAKLNPPPSYSERPMLIIKDPDASQFQVVDVEEVGPLTLQGWRLVSLFETTVLRSTVPTCDDLLVYLRPVQDPNGYRRQEEVEVPHEHVRVIKALLRYDRDDLLAEAYERLKQAQAGCFDAEQQAASAVAKLLELEEKVKAASREQQTHEERAQTARERQDELRATCNKLERDMGRLRQQLGERQWKELLGGDREEV